MRILILLPTHAFPPDTGQRHRYAHLALYLARRHDVALAYFTSGADGDETARYQDRFAEVVRVTEQGTSGALGRLLSVDPSEVYTYRSAKMQAAVERLVTSFRPEVTISGEPSLTQYLRSYSGIRVLDYICEATLQFERMRALSSGPTRWLWGLRKAKYAAFLRRIAATYDLCMVNSVEDRTRSTRRRRSGRTSSSFRTVSIWSRMRINRCRPPRVRSSIPVRSVTSLIATQSSGWPPTSCHGFARMCPMRDSA